MLLTVIPHVKRDVSGKPFRFTLTMFKAFGKNRQTKNYKFIHFYIYENDPNSI